MSRVDFDREWEPRFWRDVPHMSNATACWPWMGSKNANGYGHFSVGGRANNRRVSAHRFAYWLAHGQIEPGEVVCHSCDNPGCVNPAHLFAGTQAQNLADMTAKGRRSRFALRGESAPTCKVSDADAKRIATRIASGEKPAALAREFGVNRVSIYKIVKRAAR